MKLKLTILEDLYTIHRFPPNHEISDKVLESEFYSISRSEEEVSVVCRSSIQLNSEKSEAGWSCFKVVGPLEFSLTGILAKISAILAESEISIFAISTFDTDYILVKTEKLPLAKEALLESGCVFTN